MSKPAFFLDRDGNINIDRVYINDPRLMELIPGAAEAIAEAQKAGYLIVVVTNQSGVARGIIEESALEKIHARMDELLKPYGASVDSYKVCLHAPGDKCACRKPLPKLVLDAAKELDIDLKRSVFIGDKLSDVATGQAAGCAYSILVRTGKGELEQKAASTVRPDLVAPDLARAMQWARERLRR
jgi:D-glycero-D-manno-heptose 1,7-bisphosphate phosphatase